MTDPSGEGPQPERVLESRRLYDGRIMAVRLDTVAMPNGREATREIVEHAPVVAIVPVDENGDVVMVRQYRLATGDVMLEVPAGLVDEGEEMRGLPLALIDDPLLAEVGEEQHVGGVAIGQARVRHAVAADALRPERLQERRAQRREDAPEPLVRRVAGHPGRIAQ